MELIGRERKHICQFGTEQKGGGIEEIVELNKASIGDER